MSDRPAALETIRAALVLRDALLSSRQWGEVEAQLARQGMTLEQVRRRLQPRIAFDPHTHSVHSDGMFTYRRILWWCRAVGLEAVGITDHDNLHADMADAIEEGRRLGVHLVPGLEFTVHRLGGQAWRGLEVGLHFFPAEGFGAFLRSTEGTAFLRRFEESNRLKSEQGWDALEAVNARFMAPRGLPPIGRDALWEASGRVDPVCVGTLTVLMLEAFFAAGREDILRQLPNTRAIYTYLGRNGFVPPLKAPAQTLDDLVDIRRALSAQGIRSTLTLNHPEEWLTKCGLMSEEGAPDLPGLRRLVWLFLLHDPAECPVSFVELYSSRNTSASRRTFSALFEELRQTFSRFFPSIQPPEALASTDSHRVSGFLDSRDRVQGWVAGEDFLFGLGLVDNEHPQGNLDVPDGYPRSARELVARMEERAV